MKRFFAFLIVAFYVSIAFAAPAWFPEGIQTKGSSTIGEKSTAAASSVLDIRSTTKGMLAPRMTTAQRTAISTPATGLLVYDTDTKTFWQYNATAWVEVGSGGAGGRNYIQENPDAETDTTGWVTYADAAGSIPVDGTGGSPTVTWTRTTSTPLAETGSFLLTKDAANRQGNGVAFDFSIEPEDRGRMLQIDYSYEIASGTYATGDLSWHIYDVTNSRYIQPSAYQVENVGVQSHAQPLTFQTSIDSTSYRLILHVATTSASAYTAKFDSVKVGPQNQANGPPVTNWVAYTPTVTAISGTLTNYTVQGFWRQKGDSADYKIRLVFTGAVGTWSNPLFSIPSGHVIDDSKFPGGSISNYSDENWGTAVDSGTQNYKSAARPYTTTTLIMQQLFVSGSTVVLNSYSQASPFTWTSGDEIEFTVKNIPIVGWSSNTVVSSSANTRPVTARYTTGTAGSYGTGGAVLDFPLKVDDSHGAVTTGASWKYTAKVPGKYRVSIGLSPSGTNGLYAELYKNGVTYARLAQYRSGANPPQIAGTTKIDLAAGDYFNIVLFSETATTSLATAAHLNYIDIEKIDGPSQIAADTLIEASYTSNTGLSLSAGVAAIRVYEDKVTDTHNAYNSSTGVFTAPAPGDYMICASAVSSTVSLAVSDEFAVIFRKNSVEVYRDGVFSPVAAAITQSARGCHQFRLNATDTLDVQLLSDKAMTTNAITLRNTLHIHRLGGVH